MNMMSAEELFRNYKTFAKEDNTDAFVYLQKAADLWHKEAVKNMVGLYSRGFCIDFFRSPALRAAAKEWKNPEKGIAYGLEAEKHGIDVSWDMMKAYESIEDYEQAFHWAKIHDSRRDKPEAVEWLENESKEMASEAMKCYKRNDYQQALVYFEKAAKLGLSTAQYNCGVMYAKGEGTAVNKEKSLYWYEKAAEQGNADAQFNCGVMYIEGEGTEKNIEKSLYWFKKAAEHGSSGAQYNCGLIYDSKDSKEDKLKALYWFEKAAEQGYVKAQSKCGRMYDLYEGIPMDKEKSFYWYKKAAEQGDAKAQYMVGLHYAFGEYVVKDNLAAVRWFSAAALQNNRTAELLNKLMEKKGVFGVKFVDLVPELHKAVDRYEKLEILERHFLFDKDLYKFLPDDLRRKLNDAIFEYTKKRIGG